MYKCTDYTRYTYTNFCEQGQTPNLCGDDDQCFWSYSGKSEDYNIEKAACRPLPESLRNGEFEYDEGECLSDRGLCALGCGEGTCHNSWPVDDKLKQTSPDAMCRCKAPAP